jgi:hypothetical protein
VTHFRTNAGPTGSGKTYAATAFSCDRISKQIKTAIIQPTIRLCKQSVSDARGRFPELKPKITCIASRPGTNEKVAGRINSYLNSRDPSGELLYITHAGFLRHEYWHRAKDWHLFIDEVIDVTYYRELRLKDHRDLLSGLFRLRPFSEKYSVLEAVDHGRLMQVLDAMADDEIYEHFADLISRLLSPHWNLYVDTTLFARFEAGDVHRLEVHGLLHPSIFDPFASVTLMAANLTDSIMYKYFAEQGCTFNEHKAISRGLRYFEHTNGKQLVIKYLSDRKWSKTLRDKLVCLPGDEDADGITVGQLYMDLCQQEAAKHSPDSQPMWICNNDVSDDAFNGVRLPNVPHGMNDLQSHTVCCVMSALNPPERHRVFLQELCGMTEREIRRAILAQTAYQALGRGALRAIDQNGDFLLILPDKDSAEDIAEYYPGCRIEKLLPDLVMPEGKGRPTKYDTKEAKHEARRLQKAASMRRSRWKIKNVQFEEWTLCAISKASLSTPRLSDSAGFFNSVWHNRATRPRPTVLWEIEADRHLWQQSTPTTTEFFAQLRHRFETSVYDDKFDNWLFSPALFDLSRNSGKGHCLENVVGVQGVVLDIDHTDMTPDIIADALAPYELVIYSSFNHTPDDPSYRVVIPTTGPMTLDASKAIRMMCVQKFRDLGFGDKLTGGPKHGVDTGKLHSAALFFWPCSRPDGFFQHNRAGGPAIDPQQWLGECPAHIIDKIIGPDREGMPKRPTNVVTAEHTDRSVQAGIEYWRQHGCVRGAGRTQLWFLAKRLAEDGCSDGEMRDILWEQAGYATNPAERRGEIEGLLKDPNVMAARVAA